MLRASGSSVITTQSTSFGSRHQRGQYQPVGISAVGINEENVNQREIHQNYPRGPTLNQSRSREGNTVIEGADAYGRGSS